MNEQQKNIFELLYPTFKFKKNHIKLFEAFAGIGSQAKALQTLSNELGFKLEVVGISEFDKYAQLSYEAVHGKVHNYGDITKIDKLPNDIDIFTYSFPCQDISHAGQGKGLKKGSGTRSGLLWEVERLLKASKKPKVLLMENVKALVSKKHKEDYYEWLTELEKLGYSNYWEILNSKHFGIPQNRERVFCVSILGEYNYDFPKGFDLKLKLKDLLEGDVNSKYYLSDKMMDYIVSDNEKWTGNNGNSLVNKSVASAINTGEGSRRCDASNYILNGYTQEDLDLKKVKIASASNSREYKKRGVVQKGMIQTLKTSGYDVGVVMKDLRIRKLTPKECWRLMGFKDDSFEKAEKVVSNSQLYKQAGNSIVVNVLYHIFKQLF